MLPVLMFQLGCSAAVLPLYIHKGSSEEVFTICKAFTLSTVWHAVSAAIFNQYFHAHLITQRAQKAFSFNLQHFKILPLFACFSQLNKATSYRVDQKECDACCTVSEQPYNSLSTHSNDPGYGWCQRFYPAQCPNFAQYFTIGIFLSKTNSSSRKIRASFPFLSKLITHTDFCVCSIHWKFCWKEKRIKCYGKKECFYKVCTEESFFITLSGTLWKIRFLCDKKGNPPNCSRPQTIH